MRSRRSYLAALSAVGLAGCSTSGDREPTRTATNTVIERSVLEEQFDVAVDGPRTTRVTAREPYLARVQTPEYSPNLWSDRDEEASIILRFFQNGELQSRLDLELGPGEVREKTIASRLVRAGDNRIRVTATGLFLNGDLTTQTEFMVDANAAPDDDLYWFNVDWPEEYPADRHVDYTVNQHVWGLPEGYRRDEVETTVVVIVGGETTAGSTTYPEMPSDPTVELSAVTYTEGRKKVTVRGVMRIDDETIDKDEKSRWVSVE